MMMLTTKEAAARLGVEIVTAKGYCQRGVFPNARKVGRDWIIPETDIANFAAPANGYPRGRPRKKIENISEKA
jgi:predicted site-specific integrase-resolvase